MKINLNLKTAEDQAYLAFLLAANTLGLGLCLLLLIMQLVLLPKILFFNWVLLALLLGALSYCNHQYFKNHFSFKAVWQWLKNHN